MGEHVTHVVDEDGVEPVCGHAIEGDSMWFFNDAQVTCPRCKAIYPPARADSVATPKDEKCTHET